MKIEKINDNQIRCTLTRADLEDRQIHLSELAYGTEKAKSLFRDMMQQANSQFGFEADNIPLMIEAIPTSADSIILIITKVEDPEELDTRFSKFAPSSDSVAPVSAPPLEIEGADDIIDLFQKIHEAKTKAKSRPKSNQDTASKNTEVPLNLIREYTFSNLDTVIAAARELQQFFNGENTLYKDTDEGKYFLIIHQSERSPADFNKICNILSEYGPGKNVTPAKEAFLREHGECIIPDKALQNLAAL